jgi:hypothetical protein
MPKSSNPTSSSAYEVAMKDIANDPSSKIGSEDAFNQPVCKTDCLTTLVFEDKPKNIERANFNFITECFTSGTKVLSFS